MSCRDLLNLQAPIGLSAVSRSSLSLQLFLQSYLSLLIQSQFELKSTRHKQFKRFAEKKCAQKKIFFDAYAAWKLTIIEYTQKWFFFDTLNGVCGCVIYVLLLKEKKIKQKKGDGRQVKPQ